MTNKLHTDSLMLEKERLLMKNPTPSPPTLASHPPGPLPTLHPSPHPLPVRVTAHTSSRRRHTAQRWRETVKAHRAHSLKFGNVCTYDHSHCWVASVQNHWHLSVCLLRQEMESLAQVSHHTRAAWCTPGDGRFLITLLPSLRLEFSFYCPRGKICSCV